jgi:hypothetical protein
VKFRLTAVAFLALVCVAGASSWFVVSASRRATHLGAAPPVATAKALPARFQSYMTDTADPATAGFGYTLADTSAGGLASLTNQKAMVWVGNWTKSSCTWAISDASLSALITTYVKPNIAHVYGFYIADEPDHAPCPSAPAALRARTALIHSLLPGYPTYAVIEFPSNYAKFNGTVDIMGIDPYPCHRGASCSTTEIPSYIAALKSAGVHRYWGVLQAFQDSYYRFPTAAELTAMISQWMASQWSGQQTFAWQYAGNNLSDHPDLLAVLTRLNNGR